MRIFFNRGFSLAPIAKALMAADPSLEVVIGVGDGMPIYPGSHETWIEPSVDDEAYAEWIRTQISQNAIDIFIPTRRRKLLASVHLPCRVHLPANIATLELLEDKFAFAAAIADEEFHLKTLAIDSAADLENILPLFATVLADKVPCVKPRLGVNGHGFWKLSNGSPMTHILNPDVRVMRQDLFLAALKAQEADGTLSQFVLMEYLPGPEVSFDVLCNHGTILKYVARTKEASHQRLQTNHPLEVAAQNLVARFSLHGVVNVQFRKAYDGSWKALEINARPAGGSVYGEDFGTSLLADWGGLLTGRLTPETVSQPDLDFKLQMVSNLTLMTENLAA